MARSKLKEVRMAVIGYGGAFNMAKAHAHWASQGGIKLVAACDVDPARAAAAAEDFPGIATYTDVARMLKQSEFELAVIVTPHNTHADIAVQCAKAGRHVVVEKPMCITVAEADAMIAAAKKAGTALTVFHNRRHDGDYLALKEIVDKGLIGDVFKVEMYMGGYGRPGDWWRSDKAISGGAFYDWGAHMLDWCLHIVGQRISHVMGYFHENLVWTHVSNEDHVHALIKFESGATADVQLSSIQRIGKPRWRVLGTKGAVEDLGDKFRVVTEIKGITTDMTVPYKKAEWDKMPFYVNLAKHLRQGAPLEVTAESARRPIAICEAAEIASKTGLPQAILHEDEGLYL
jgi:predicted dehydrogenase